MTAQPSAGHAAWAQRPERSNLLMLRLMSWISLRLGRRIGRAVLHLIAAYFLLFAPASRRASRNYLGRALGRPARWHDLYRHFFSFAATIHDRIYLVNRRFDLFEIEVHGEDTLQRLLAFRLDVRLVEVEEDAIADILGEIGFGAGNRGAGGGDIAIHRIRAGVGGLGLGMAARQKHRGGDDADNPHVQFRVH